MDPSQILQSLSIQKSENPYNVSVSKTPGNKWEDI